MSTRSIGLLALSTVVAAFAGCRIKSFSMSAGDRGAYEHYDYDHHDYDHYAPRPAPVRVYVNDSHHHGSGCGHHWSGSTWIVVAERKGNSHHYKRTKPKKNKRRH